MIGRGGKVVIDQLSRNSMILVLVFFLSLTEVSAQCAMCRAVLESSDNSPKAEAVNDGIMYLMAIPYLLVAILGFVVYRMYNNAKKAKSGE